MTADKKYRLLRDKVFPPNELTIRIDFDFSPTSISTDMVKEFGLDALKDKSRERDRSQSNYLGGELIAPVLQLVRVAKDLGRIPEIESLMESRENVLGVESKESLAIKVLIAIAQNEFVTAQKKMEDLEHWVSTRPIDAACLGPEMVVISSAADVPHLQDQAFVFAFRFRELTDQENLNDSEPWRRHLFAWLSQFQRKMQEDASAEKNLLHSVASWHPVTRSTSETNGRGYPSAEWFSQSGRLSKVKGHDRDYLYYAIPLKGDFVVEANVSAFNYEETRLGYGGIWAGPKFDHKTILHGQFAGDDETIAIAPALDEIRDSMRVRLIVKDGVRTTEINGRNVFEARVSQNDPWLSIFSHWYTHGWVHDLRISGAPVVPREIDLATNSELPGWNSYFEQSQHDQESDWRLTPESEFVESDFDPTNQSPEFVLQGVQHPELNGSFQESLLRYHRPMIEDGVISYDFFYREGEFEVHPALDRCVYLIGSDGVKVHWISDGRYERTGIDPANSLVESVNQRGDKTLPLKQKQWNHVELIVSGDVVNIQLNGALVFERKLEPTNLRTFGLFHYADSSAAAVKNIRWRGDWPKSLPSPHHQELANATFETILEGSKLLQTFEYDFAQGLPLDKFLISGEGWRDHLDQLTDGIQTRLKGRDYHIGNQFSPQLRIDGDFDIIAAFDGFDAAIAEGGDGNIHLKVAFEHEQTECCLYRKFSRFEKKQFGQQVIQTAKFHTHRGQRAWVFPTLESEATKSGKLRLIRRGDQLHYLFAYADSSHYRLLHTEPVPRDSVLPGNLQLCIETTKPGHASVVWNSLSVRAESLSGLATAPSFTVAQLNHSRESLRDHVELDFADPVSSKQFDKWGQDTQFRMTRDGLLVTAPGFDTWQGHAVVPRVEFSGDFDVSVDIDIKKLQNADPGGESVVYLQTEFRNLDKNTIESKFAKSDRGNTTGEIQIRRVNPHGEFDYKELATIPLKNANQLRIARRKGIAYFLVQDVNDLQPTMLGRLDVGETPIQLGDLRIMLHTSGEGHETIVLLKKLTLHADKIKSPLK
ncbi:DUF1583 domain-containing protein [Novipirellula sp.]|uniref:DUF1583 domain-containing protein n=1 Tax=Novipirellula sp. TaxID=2795430 RepID=UPI0035681AAE